MSCINHLSLRIGAVSAAMLLAGLFAPPALAADRDGDGVSNKDDRCPDEAEDIDGYRDEVKSDEPALVFYQSTSNQAMLEHAAGLGAHTLMTGYGADELVGQPPFYLHELLRRGKWISAWHESARWARAGNRRRHYRSHSSCDCAS